MNDGYIKVFRKILSWEWYDDVNTFKLWMHLLLIVNHKDNKWRGEVIKRGSTVTSYAQLSIQTGLTVQQVRTSLKKLQKTGEVTKVTSSKNTVIIVTNYDKYQDTNKQDNNQTNNELTNNQQSGNKQVTTNKNDKKDKNEKNDKNINNILSIPYDEIVELFNRKCKKLSSVIKLTDKRKKSIKARYEEYGNIDIFETLFDKANDSDFLCGENDKGWKANFDWLMNPNNMIKVLEDRYANKKSMWQELYEEVENEQERSFEFGDTHSNELCKFY